MEIINNIKRILESPAEKEARQERLRKYETALSLIDQEAEAKKEALDKDFSQAERALFDEKLSTAHKQEAKQQKAFFEAKLHSARRWRALHLLANQFIRKHGVNVLGEDKDSVMGNRLDNASLVLMSDIEEPGK